MTERDRSAPEGLVVVDKEPGWTSHDVVAKLRGILGTRKVGHAGTLDPDATGVLLVGVGGVTRLLRFVGGTAKTYTGEVVFGTETSSLDSSGAVTAIHRMDGLQPEAVNAAAAGFVGAIEQVPPMVSAVQVGGRRLHELARAGIEVERNARPVTIHAFDVTETADPLVYRLHVRCSSGTYVRSLAADLGAALGGGAHLRSLRRVASGSFTVDEASVVGAVGAGDLLSAATALRDLPFVEAGPDLEIAIGYGRMLDRADLGVAGDGPWAVVGSGGALLAVYESRGSRVKPAVVMPRHST
ncbi:MAG: tRNA pseudouridine(55) synthase TruB [Acidimicrobiia bacterium]